MTILTPGGLEADDRPLHVGNPGAARNQRWSSIDIPVPHAPGYFVASVPTMDQLTAKDLPKILKVCGVDRTAIRLHVSGSQHRHVGTSNRVAA